MRRRRSTGCCATHSPTLPTPVGRRGRPGAGRVLLLPAHHAPLDQAPFDDARARIGDATMRRQVLAGAYRLVDAGQRDGRPTVQIAASGAVVPEALAAAAELEDEGIAAHVIDVTSLDRLYAAWQRTLRQGIRTATTPSIPVPCGRPSTCAHRSSPCTTPRATRWRGSVCPRVPAVSLGVDSFGQSGTVNDLYEIHDLTPGSIVNGALAALALR